MKYSQNYTETWHKDNVYVHMLTGMLAFQTKLVYYHAQQIEGKIGLSGPANHFSMVLVVSQIWYWHKRTDGSKSPNIKSQSSLKQAIELFCPMLHNNADFCYHLIMGILTHCCGFERVHTVCLMNKDFRTWNSSFTRVDA